MASKLTMEQAFDEWTRKYWENPELFGRIVQSIKTVQAHVKKKGASADGIACAALMRGLMKNGKKHWGKRAK
jgi:hypothetical protein